MEFPLLGKKEDVIRYVNDNDVTIINLWFCDILGRIKSFGIPPAQLEVAFEEGLGFDGSSVEGFARIYESDLLAKPIPETFRVLPWTVDGKRTARVICDVLTPDMAPYPGDPRHLLKAALERLKKDGYTFNVGPELEFSYFKSSEATDALDPAGYFDLIPFDLGSEIRQEAVHALQAMGISVEAAHHEVAPSQHEIDLKHTDALTMADQTITYRFLVKEVARRRGIYATFMPKPVFAENGNGMHVHQSLFKNGDNSFFDREGQYFLSEVGRHYLAGILRHCREIVAVTNQWVNSYKRLVPGYEAPVYVAWGQRNRSALVRVPRYKPGKAQATRVEFRCPDPACNPYLAFAVMVGAGMKGVEEKYTLPDPVEEDIYLMTESERAARSIETLPDSLYASLQIAESSGLVREVLGEHVFTKFLENKYIEWDNYRVQVTEYEKRKYLPIL
jgi:glutamine synthetase